MAVKLILKDSEVTVQKGPCCPMRMKMRKHYGDFEHVDCSAPGRPAILQASEYVEARMGHDTYRRVDIDRGAGVERIPLPLNEYLDDNRMAGAFSHYPLNEACDALAIPRCSYNEFGFILYVHTEKGWQEKERLPEVTLLLGLSDQDQFVFYEREKARLLLVNSSTFEKCSIDLVTTRFVNAHLSEDRTQVLIIGVSDIPGAEGVPIYQLGDFKSAQSIALHAGENTVECSFIKNSQFVFPADATTTASPIWGENHYSIQIEVS